MPTGMPRKERLVELLKLAQLYRGWSVRRLADELGRDPHNLLPESGVPKLDLVVRLAEALDWPVEMVIEDLCSAETPSSKADGNGHGRRTARLRNEEARRRLYTGDFEGAAAAARAVIEEAPSADDRAYACAMLASSLEANGHYLRAVEAARQGLRLGGPASPWRDYLAGQVALNHYLLGNLDEADGMACAIIERLADLERSNPLRGALALAHAVRGHCARLTAPEAAPPVQRALVRRGLEHFREAQEHLRDWQSWGGGRRDETLAELAEAASLELLVLDGVLPARAAVNRLLAVVGAGAPEDEEAPQAADGEAAGETPNGSAAGGIDSDQAELRAWCCVFGSAIAVRHLTDEPDLDRLLAIFTNIADELAELLGHWAVRERVWTIEHVHRRQRVRDGGDDPGPWLLDSQEIRTLTGTMGRFPHFRAIGWEVFRERAREAEGGE